MRLNNFNEKLHDLQETLQILHKKSIQNNGLSGIDQEVIKFKLIEFYETFFIKEGPTPLSSEIKEGITEVHSKEVEAVSMKEVEKVVEQEANVLTSPEIEAIPSRSHEVETIEVVKTTEEPIIEAPLIEVSMASHLTNPSSNLIEEVFSEVLTSTPPIAESKSEAKAMHTAPTKGLNDRFSHIQSGNSLNERFKSNSGAQGTERFNAPVSSMNEMLDLNKKLLYVTQLFGGNHELFQQVLRQIDAFNTSVEAIHFMEHNKPKLNLSEKQEDIYLNFLEVIKRKF